MELQARTADWILPFVRGATATLSHELGVTPRVGPVSEIRAPLTSAGVSVLLTVTGAFRGVVVYDMDEPTALAIASTLAEIRFLEFDELAESAVAELGNVITGQAGVELDQLGQQFQLSLPSVVRGKGSLLTVPETVRQVVPVEIPAGTIRIFLALEET